MNPESHLRSLRFDEGEIARIVSFQKASYPGEMLDFLRDAILCYVDWHHTHRPSLQPDQHGPLRGMLAVSPVDSLLARLDEITDRLDKLASADRTNIAEQFSPLLGQFLSRLESSSQTLTGAVTQLGAKYEMALKEIRLGLASIEVE